MKAWLILACCLIAPASSASPKLHILGPGASSCGKWLEDRQEHRYSEIDDQSWVLGFLTGFNGYGPQIGHSIMVGTDISGVSAWLDNYCRLHPTDTIADGAASFVNYEMPKAINGGQ